MLPNQWDAEVCTDFKLGAGTAYFEEAVEIKAPVFEGLQLIVSLDCCLLGGVNRCEPFRIHEPAVYLVLATGQHDGYDRYEPHTLQRGVRMGIDAAGASRMGLDFEQIMRQSFGKKLHHSDVQVKQQPLDAASSALAMQILGCPLEDPWKSVYLAGKALELMAVSLAPGTHQRTLATLGQTDMERLWHVRHLLDSRYQEPLSLHGLARSAGTNVKKLNADFKQVFGMTVFDYLRQVKLEKSHQMLATGAFSIAEVASLVGYTAAHFSTVFSKRFGYPPSHLL